MKNLRINIVCMVESTVLEVGKIFHKIIYLFLSIFLFSIILLNYTTFKIFYLHF